MANQKKERVMSPRGRAHYPWVRKPDTKYKAKGEFKCGVVLTKADPDTQEFIGKLEAARDAVVQELTDGNMQWMGDTIKLKPYQIKDLNIHPVYTDIVDDDTGEPTGEIIVTAKQNAVYGKDDAYRANISVVNSKGKPDAGLNVFGGDTIKELMTLDGFWNAKDQLVGLTKRLVAVQVIESNGMGAGGDLGFEDEGDGALGSPAGESFADESEDGNDDDDSSQDGADF